MSNKQLAIMHIEGDVYQVKNYSYDNVDEHEYKVFAHKTAYHCTCPAFKYQNKDCKHMEIVNDMLNEGDL